MNEILDSERHYNENDGPSLEELRANGYTFDFGRYFGTGWRAMKSDIGQYILYTLVMGIILTISIITIVGPIVLALPLTAGYLTYGRKAMRGEPREFNDFFGGFKTFGPLVGYTLILIGAFLLFGAPLFVFSGLGIGALANIDNDPEAALALIVGALAPLQIAMALLSIVIQTLLFFAVPLIALGKLGAFSAIKWSFRLSTRNFFWILLYVFVVGIISQAGVIACYIGLLFTAPLGQMLNLGAYADIVGLGDKSDASTEF
jgi:uncharacterized membrane protein